MTRHRKGWEINGESVMERVQAWLDQREPFTSIKRASRKREMDQVRKLRLENMDLKKELESYSEERRRERRAELGLPPLLGRATR